MLKRLLVIVVLSAAVSVMAVPEASQVRPPVTAAAGGGDRMADWGGTAQFSLEITMPRNDLPAHHRMKHAYTGLLYEVPIAAIGGVAPYLYEITAGAGAGMKVDARTGIISWPNPTANATPTIRVTDTKGTQVIASWTITVGTRGFRCVDAVNGVAFASNAGGSLSGTCWRTLKDAIGHSAPTDIVYFKTGTYTGAGIEFAAADGRGAGLGGLYFEAGPTSNNLSSSVWLAYPGHAPVFDAEFNGKISSAYQIDVQGDGAVWFEGFDFSDTYWKFLQMSTGMDNAMLFRNKFHGHNGQISNGSMVMFPHGRHSRVAIIENNFHNEDASLTPDDGLALLLYNTDKILIERNTFTRLAGSFSPKAGDSQFTFRANTLNDFPKGHGLESNMNADSGQITGGEINFNNFNGPFRDPFAGCITLGASSIAPIGRITFARNTLRGPLKFGSTEANLISADDGPFVFLMNVIENGDSRASPYPFFTLHPDFGRNPFDWKRVNDTSNLKGTAGAKMLDAAGLLTGSFRTSNGPTSANPRGHELPP